MTRDLTIRLTGTAPLLMHAGRLADPMDAFSKQLASLTSKRMKTEADYERIAHVEWLGGLWLANGKPCIPAEALEAAMVQAAKCRRAGSLLRSALTVRDSAPLEHRGPADLEALYADAAFRHRCGVRIGTRTAIRTRPRFDQWQVTATLTYAPAMIDAATLMDFVRHAGDAVGLGDWRPRFGRFRVDDAG